MKEEKIEKFNRKRYAADKDMDLKEHLLRYKVILSSLKNTFLIKQFLFSTLAVVLDN